MTTLIWILVTALTAAGSALLVCYQMRCRMDEAVAREKGALAELESALSVQRARLATAINDAKAEAKRVAFDEFLNDFRVEQRQYVRRSRGLFVSRNSLVLRERILFRNLPLSDWVERTVMLDENVGAPALLSGQIMTIPATLNS